MASLPASPCCSALGQLVHCSGARWKELRSRQTRTPVGVPKWVPMTMVGVSAKRSRKPRRVTAAESGSLS